MEGFRPGKKENKLGIRASDTALAYAKEREQFGKPIAKFQAVQFQPLSSVLSRA